MPFDRAVASTPKTGLSLKKLGRHYIVHATGSQTGGAVGIWEVFPEPGKGVPIHTHSREDEVFRVLEGTFRFWCGDQTFEGAKGFTIVLPRQVRHGFQNTGTTEGHLLALVMPGGFEQFFVEMDQLGDAPSQEAMVALDQKYGVVTHGPPPQS